MRHKLTRWEVFGLWALSVGVISWVLPRVAILDRLGLNDYVIARNRISATGALMAHDRRPPPGYQECFAPNVKVESGRVVIVPRSPDLTARRIIECERTFAALVASGS